jgi:hypothetical protein
MSVNFILPDTALFHPLHTEAVDGHPLSSSDPAASATGSFCFVGIFWLNTKILYYFCTILCARQILY